MRPALVAHTLLLTLATATRAQDRSADLELLRPVAGPGGAGSFALPGGAVAHTARWSTQLAWTHRPIVLYEWDAPAGAVVADRLTLTAGAGYDLNDTLSVDVSAPVAAQWGGEVLELRADGAHGGDLSFALTAQLRSKAGLALATRAELYEPVGAKDAWVGEQRARLALWGLVSARGRALEVGGRFGVLLRSPDAGPSDLRLTSELRAEPVLRLHASERVALWGHLATRATVANGLLVSVEPVVGASVRLTEHGWIDLGGGRGLSQGYGTSAGRFLIGWRAEIAPRPPHPQVTHFDDEEPAWLRDAVLDDEDSVLAAEPEAKPAAAPVAEVPWLSLAERVQFAQNSAALTPDGERALAEVAEALAAHPEVLHVVAEGHASVEGTDDWNWRLSQARGQAVYDALVDLGVDPKRLSYRGLGEREPDSDAALARSRRVVFHVIAMAPAPQRASNDLADLGDSL